MCEEAVINENTEVIIFACIFLPNVEKPKARPGIVRVPSHHQIQIPLDEAGQTLASVLSVPSLYFSV